MENDLLKFKGDERNNNLFSKLRVHVGDVALSRSLRFMFYRLLHIINRRIQLPPGCFLGDIEDKCEMKLVEFINPRKNLIFVDIGAKFGLWTLKLSKRCKKIYAFEPNPETNSLLKKSIRKLNNAKIYPYALGEKNVFEKFFVHKKLGLCGLLNRNLNYEQTIIVPVRTLDSFNFDTIDIIKIDTEGYELPILKGGRKTIEREKPQLYIEIHEEEHKIPIIKFLKEVGYKYTLHHVKNKRQPIIITDYKLAESINY